MSGAELARTLGVSQAYVWRRMSGDLPFSLDDVERIAAALGVEPVSLIPVGHAEAGPRGGAANPRYMRLLATTVPRGAHVTPSSDLLLTAA